MGGIPQSPRKNSNVKRSEGQWEADTHTQNRRKNQKVGLNIKYTLLAQAEKRGVSKEGVKLPVEDIRSKIDRVADKPA